MIVDSRLGRRYARAVLQLGIADRQFERYGEELQDVARAFAQKELMKTVCAPQLKGADRRAVLVAVLNKLNVAPYVHNLLLLLFDRNRVTLIDDIAREYRDLADAHAGRVRATLGSALPLDAETAGQIQGVLQKRLQKEVWLETETDESLLGGVRVQVGSMVFDGSIKAKLSKLRSSLVPQGISWRGVS